MPMPDSSVIGAGLIARMSVRPRLALVLGSGFQDALDDLQVQAEIPYAKIPGFPRPTVRGHAGRLVIGTIANLPLIALYGRAHYYEGLDMAQVTFPIRVLAAMGVRDLLLTNAAGGINPRVRPGDFMCITDHINFMGANPLRGGDPLQGRFVDLTAVYDPGFIALWRRAARKAKVRLATGVYLAVSGPSYETPAEIGVYAQLGADAVGMSTVPEAIVARQCGLRVTALSCVTNLAAGRTAKPLSHEEVLETGQRVTKSARTLLRAFIDFYAKAQ